MALMVRPFLSVEELAGVPVSQSQNLDSQTMLNYGKMVGQGLDNQQKRMQMDELLQSKQESDDFNKSFAEKLKSLYSPQQPQQEAPAQAVVPATQPTQITPIQPQQAPVTAQPSEGATSYPVRDGQAESRPLDAPAPVMQPAAPVQTQALGNAPAPAASVEAAPQAPAQAAVASPTPQQEVKALSATAPKAVPSAETFTNAVRSTPVTPQGQFNPLSDDYLKVMQQTLAEAVTSGQMRPSTAQAIFGANQAAVNKGIKDRYEMLEAAAKARNAGLDGDKRAAELAELKRKQMIDSAQTIMNTFRESPAAAQAMLKPLGFGDMDLSNPEQFKALAGLAASSTESVDRRKEERKDARETTELKPVPGVAGAFYNRDGKIVNGEGQRLTTEQVQVMDQNSRKSGATTINTGDQANPYQAGGKKFAEKIGEDDAGQVRALRDSSVASNKAISSLDRLQGILTDANGNVRQDIPLGPGQGLTALAERLGLKDKKEAELFIRNEVGQISAALELSAAGKMKGQGAITDSERAILRKAEAGDFANFTASEWVAFANTMKRYHTANIAANNDEVNNIGKRQTDFPIDTFRVEPSARASASPQAAPSAGMPKKGQIVNGFTFMGGDPRDQRNWVK